MNGFEKCILAGLVSAGVLLAPSAWAAGDVAAPANAGSPNAALDPAVRREFGALASSLLIGLGAAMSAGSLEDFDPGPAVEKALGRALSGPEINALLDRLVAQMSGATEAGDLPPELRAALRLAIRNMIGAARRELGRDPKMP